MEIVRKLSDSSYAAMRNNELCVVKQIFPEDVDVFRAIAGIDSPYIAKIHEVAVIDDKICAVREYIQGTSLAEILEKNGCMSESETKRIIRCICKGLGKIHALGIVHRDINPNNIIITRDGTPVIIDFGISRMHKKNQARDTQILGTQGYAAPEQFGFGQTDVTADIYSLGVMMNYMRTLKMPNEKMAGGVIGRVAEKCTRMDEKKRYQSAGAVARALGKPFISRLPGFETDVLWHKFAAAALYFFCFVCVSAPLVSAEGQHVFYWLVSGTIMFILPIPVLTNYRNFLGSLKAKSAFGAALKRTVSKAVIVAGLWVVWGFVSVIFDLYPNITV